MYTYFLIYHHFCCCCVSKLCLTLFDPMDCSLPVSSVHRISQARILEWVAISFSRGFYQPRDWTHVSCILARFFITEPPLSYLPFLPVTYYGKIDYFQFLAIIKYDVMNIFIIKYWNYKYRECCKTLIHITNIYPEFVLLLVSHDPSSSSMLKLSLQSWGRGNDLFKVIKWQVLY